MNATAPIPAPGTVVPGQLLAGKYRVERVLGEGGMGIVLAAMNEMLHQRVAVKLLRPGALENTEALGRFLREARAAAKLRSEHVARVVDTGSLEDGRPYMVMEYLEGQDLGDVIEKASPPPTIAQSVDYVLQVCEAIAEAHGAGIVHRDLKPRNLFLTRTVDGRPLVKVLDFGISKLDDGQENMQLTRTTEVIGSPSYMSPEQLRSARYVDHRTDIWALGVILYELLSGRLPFYASTVTELVAVVLMEREPPLAQLRADVPAQLSNVIGRCLAKRPEDRYQSVLELVHDLEPFGIAGTTSAADRVRGVALAASGSNRALPPSASSSGQLPYVPPALGSARTGPSSLGPSASSSGGTSTAWADTRLEASPPKPMSTTTSNARGPLFGVAVTLAVLLGLGAGGGALWYAKYAHAKPFVGDAPPPPMPLPSGRKDLPPIAPPATASPQGASTITISSDPAPPPADTASSASVASGRPRPPARPTGAPPRPASGTTDNPLENIGRR